MKAPNTIPEKGFYYHYKHDPNGTVNNYAYEIIGVGCHTEDDCRPEDANPMIYRPLYEEAFVYKNGKLFNLRPLEMFMGDVKKDGITIPRFKQIIDPIIIAELKNIRERMYDE